MKFNVLKPANFLAAFFFIGILSLPAAAQIDLSGTWVAKLHQDYQERAPGPEIVDYMGLPINAEARAKALAYTASQIAMPERQCLYYPPTYQAFGPFNIRLAAINDNMGRLIGWAVAGTPDLVSTTIWMDGRPHPLPNAPHTFDGFTTGKWEGDVLVTYTTHFKAGYLRRNGVPLSDAATLTRHFMRHGDVLTITQYIDDPVYLSEPEVVSRSWKLDVKASLNNIVALCTPETEIERLDGRTVPHYLPGKNPFIDEMTKLYNIPQEAVLGGAETMYPEYRKKLEGKYTPIEKCVRYCCGWVAGAATDLIKCIGVGYATPGEPFGRRFN